MSKRKVIKPLVTGIFCILSLSSIESKAQEVEHKQHSDSHSQHAFSDKGAVEKMAKNFESAERDSMQQPQKVIEYLGSIKGKKIMDIGAATGYFSVKFAAKGAFVIAADVSDGFQEYLKERIEKEKIINIELRKVPYDSPSLRDKEVDMVFIANTYHHIENRPTYFAKVRQGLKRGGELVVLDFFKVEFKEKVQAPAMDMRASIDEVVFELKRAGFTSFEVAASLLPYQYIIKAK